MDAGQKRKIAWGLIVVLGIVHYDFWYWDDPSLVFGFMPVGLFFHVLISVLAGLCWALVVRWAWPDSLEEWASEGDSDTGSDAAGRGES